MSESFLPTQSSSKDTHPNKAFTHARALFDLFGIFTGVPDVPVFWFMAMYAVAIRIHMARYHKPCVGRRCWISGRFSLHWLKRRCELETRCGRFRENGGELWTNPSQFQRKFSGDTYIHAIYSYTYIYIDTYLHDTRFIRTQYTHTINKYIYIYICIVYICIHNIYIYIIHMLYTYELCMKMCEAVCRVQGLMPFFTPYIA